jgi:HPt (histidine-containing phosphotransfer) domain-containing protein
MCFTTVHTTFTAALIIESYYRALGSSFMTKIKLQKLDVEILKAAYDGMPEFMLLQALSLYLEESRVFIATINNAQQLNTPEVIRSFHNLKTMSGMIGAIKMMSVCQAYEDCTTKNQQLVLIHQLNTEWEYLSKEVNLIIENHDLLK